MRHLRLLLLALLVASAGACGASEITASDCPGGTMGSGTCE